MQTQFKNLIVLMVKHLIKDYKDIDLFSSNESQLADVLMNKDLAKSGDYPIWILFIVHQMNEILLNNPAQDKVDERILKIVNESKYSHYGRAFEQNNMVFIGFVYSLYKDILSKEQIFEETMEYFIDNPLEEPKYEGTDMDTVNTGNAFMAIIDASLCAKVDNDTSYNALVKITKDLNKWWNKTDKLTHALDLSKDIIAKYDKEQTTIFNREIDNIKQLAKDKIDKLNELAQIISESE